MSSSTGGGIDARQALTYVFKDEQWVGKLAVGAVLSLGPLMIIGIFPLMGYLVEIVRRVSAGSEEPLPEWSNNLGTYFRQGFPVAFGVLTWLLPYQLVWIGAALVVGPQGLTGQLVFGIVVTLVGTNLYAAVLLPSVIGRYAARPRFGSMFELGEIFGSVRRIGTGFGAVFVVHVAVLAITFVTIWTIVLVIFATSYAVMVFGHAYGQATRIGYPDQRPIDA